jgi:lysophospholipase L1-like esterase
MSILMASRDRMRLIANAFIINIIVFVVLAAFVEFLSFAFLKVYEVIYLSDSNETSHSTRTPTQFNNDLNRLTGQRGGAWKYSSLTTYANREFSSETINQNEYGIRETVGTDPKCTGEIWMFGSSAVWGNANTDSTTVSSMLQKEVNSPESHKCYNVINYGVVGYMSRLDVQSLRRELLLNNPPDFVVFLNGANDFLKPMHNQTLSHLDDMRLEIEDLFIAPYVTMNELWENSQERNLITWNYVLDFFPNTVEFTSRLAGRIRYYFEKHDNEALVSSYRSRRNAAQQQYKKLLTANLDMLLQNIVLVKGLSTEYGFDVIVSLQPVVFESVYNSSDTTIAMTDEEVTGLGTVPRTRLYPSAYGDLILFKTLYSSWDEAYRRKATQLGFHYLPLHLEISSDPEQYFVSGLHYSPEGSEEIAKRIAHIVRAIQNR